MRMVKPLAELLKQADELIKIGSSATIPSNDSSTVLSVADKLIGDDSSLDKVAEAICRLQVASVLETDIRVAGFEKKAREEGFSLEQIEEALSKVAAEKLHKNVASLVALGCSPLGEDKNKRSEKPNKKAYSKMLGDYDLTKNMGYGT